MPNASTDAEVGRALRDALAVVEERAELRIIAYRAERGFVFTVANTGEDDPSDATRQLATLLTREFR